MNTGGEADLVNTLATVCVLMKNEHRRRSGRTNRPNELGGL